MYRKNWRQFSDIQIFNKLTHVFFSDVLDENENVVIEDGVFEVRRLEDLMSVFGERDVSRLVAAVQDLDLGVVMLRQVQVARHASDARRVWGS